MLWLFANAAPGNQDVPVKDFEMAITIGSNIASLKAQRLLGEADMRLRSVMERLASGQRINRASDDAAGLAIADSLRADTRVYAQAIRNLNDGISILNIADSAIESLTTVVIRLQELTQQAANGSLGSAQRDALDAEAQALSAEYLRIAQSTKFNGKQLFAGFGALNLQAGAGAYSTISGGFGGAVGTGAFGGGLSALGSGNDVADLNNDGHLDVVASGASGSINIQLGNGDGTFQPIISINAQQGAVINVALGDFNGDGYEDVVASDPTGESTVMLGRGDGTFSFGSFINTIAGTFDLAVGDFNGDGFDDIVGGSLTGHVEVAFSSGNGTFGSLQSITMGGQVTDVTAGDFNGDGIDDIAAVTDGAGVLWTITSNGNGTFGNPANVATVGAGVAAVRSGDFNNDGRLDLATGSRVVLQNADGTFSVSATLSGASGVAVGDFNGDGNEDVITSNSIYFGNGSGGFDYQGAISGGTEMHAGDFNGDGVLDFFRPGAVHLGLTTDGVGAILPFSLQSLSDARDAMSVLARKRDDLIEQRGIIGAFQSRVTVATSVLQTTLENYKAAEARIRDADIAADMAEFVRLTILRQAAAAVLAQANQEPQIALKLLEQAGTK